jgi:hypothetical protein
VKLHGSSKDTYVGNGTPATCLAIEKACIVLQLLSGEVVDVERISFELDDGFERKQFPLILGWASTIHKVQGMQFPKVIVDFCLDPGIPSAIRDSNRPFRHGMAYMALSRSNCVAIQGRITLELLNNVNQIALDYWIRKVQEWSSTGDSTKKIYRDGIHAYNDFCLQQVQHAQRSAKRYNIASPPDLTHRRCGAPPVPALFVPAAASACALESVPASAFAPAPVCTPVSVPVLLPAPIPSHASDFFDIDIDDEFVQDILSANHGLLDSTFISASAPAPDRASVPAPVPGPAEAQTNAEVAAEASESAETALVPLTVVVPSSSAIFSAPANSKPRSSVSASASASVSASASAVKDKGQAPAGGPSLFASAFASAPDPAAKRLDVSSQFQAKEGKSAASALSKSRQILPTPFTSQFITPSVKGLKRQAPPPNPKFPPSVFPATRTFSYTKKAKTFPTREKVADLIEV